MRLSKIQQLEVFKNHVIEVKECRACPDMIGPVVCASPILSRIILVGQAPGIKEGEFGKPFAWTAGKTLFKWFASIGLDEEVFRRKVFIAAVCKCFPGKNPKGGDRVPEEIEIANCRRWLDREIEILSPKLIIPVGKLAAQQFLSFEKLSDIVGQSFKAELNGRKVDLVCLPHPSGASTWHRMEPGKTLLSQALSIISNHEEWKAVCR